MSADEDIFSLIVSVIGSCLEMIVFLLLEKTFFFHNRTSTDGVVK
jgi:hypothetical protein